MDIDLFLHQKYNLYYKDIYGENLTEISYAGCIAGIADNTDEQYNIPTMKVEGAVTVLGETVGTYFGLIGQNMMLVWLIILWLKIPFLKAKFVAACGERGVINEYIIYPNEITTPCLELIR